MANKQQFIKDKKLIRPTNKSTVTNSQTIIITTAVFCLFLWRGASHLSWLHASPMSGCHLWWLSWLCFPCWALRGVADILGRGWKHPELEGENVRTSFHMSLVQMDWETQPLTTHPDFRLVPPRQNWQAKGLQKLRWSPEHQLHLKVGNTFPGCVFQAPTCSPSEKSAVPRPPAGCRMLPVTWHPGAGLSPDFVFSCTDVSRERERDLKTHMDHSVSLGTCLDSDKSGGYET